MTNRLLLALLMLLAPTAFADPLFESQDPLSIRLNAPFETIDRERDKEKEYEGSVVYEDPELGTTTLDAKFSVRGNFRLRKDVCSHAQLWVNLKKSQVKNTLFDKQDKLKLVIQCKDASRYTEYLAREHQAYLMYAELTERSLDTRLVNATFADSEEGGERTQLAFFIQHQKRLAKALDMDVVDTPTADRSRLDSTQSALVAMYMYFLSNTDYSMIAAPPGEGCCHNVKVLESEDKSLFPIPYDFDSTGFVNAPYAEPSAGLNQRNVRQRMYRGYCEHNEAIADAIALLQEKRERLYEIFNDETYISGRGLKRTADYIDDFYELVENPKKLQREIYEECR